MCVEVYRYATAMENRRLSDVVFPLNTKGINRRELKMDLFDRQQNHVDSISKL